MNKKREGTKPKERKARAEKTFASWFLSPSEVKTPSPDTVEDIDQTSLFMQVMHYMVIQVILILLMLLCLFQIVAIQMS